MFYIASEYQRMVSDKSLYSTVLQKLPTPKFLVFYNGNEYQKEVTYLKLSDSYESSQEEPDLELKVTVYNINVGYNKKLMESCRTLAEYAAYVERVRRYTPKLPLDQAVERAVTECIKEGILREFLSRNRAEVIKVSIFEYDKEEEEKKLRKAEYEAGVEDGIAQGLTHGIITMGREFGLTDEVILLQLKEKLGIEEEKAKKYLEGDAATMY